MKSGFAKRTDPALKWLEPVFAVLPRVLKEYIQTEGEPPYHNNEAASISLLVAAGARSGYGVLSDYRTDKRAERRDRNGRCDFYIQKRGKYLEIEAKQIYGRSPGAKGIKTGLGKARKDSKALRGCGQ